MMWRIRRMENNEGIDVCEMCDKVVGDNFYYYCGLRFCSKDHAISYLFDELAEIKKQIKEKK